MSRRQSQSNPSNFEFSSPAVPNFTENTRENYERFMLEARRGYDSSTPSYSLNDITRVRLQENLHLFQHDHNTREGQATTVNHPESEESAVPTLASVDDLLNAPGRTTLTKLSPNREERTIWFRRDSSGKITKQLLKMLKSDLPKPYPTYRSLPQEIKNRWFRAFAQEFTWDSSITEKVRDAYMSQADLSFRSNLREWKKLWKTRGTNNLPEWMKARKSLFEGYIKMWTDEKVVKTAQKNSKNRASDRGGLGIAIHNNGAKTFELRFEEMTSEAGKEPDMMKFMEETHLNKKTRQINDMKAKQILEEAKTKMELTASQRETEGDEDVQSNTITASEINTIMLEAVPKVKGRRFGFGKLLDDGCTSSDYTSRSLEHEHLLRDEIQTLKQREKEKDAQIQYLMECNKLLLEKFPDIRPPSSSLNPGLDEDETQP